MLLAAFANTKNIQLKSFYSSQFITLFPLPLYFSSCLHSEEDTEERSDNRGGKRSWLVQWLRDAGVSWTLK